MSSGVTQRGCGRRSWAWPGREPHGGDEARSITLSCGTGSSVARSADGSTEGRGQPLVVMIVRKREVLSFPVGGDKHQAKKITA